MVLLLKTPLSLKHKNPSDVVVVLETNKENPRNLYTNCIIHFYIGCLLALQKEMSAILFPFLSIPPPSRFKHINGFSFLLKKAMFVLKPFKTKLVLYFNSNNSHLRWCSVNIIDARITYYQKYNTSLKKNLKATENMLTKQLIVDTLTQILEKSFII